MNPEVLSSFKNGASNIIELMRHNREASIVVLSLITIGLLKGAGEEEKKAQMHEHEADRLRAEAEQFERK